MNSSTPTTNNDTTMPSADGSANDSFMRGGSLQDSITTSTNNSNQVTNNNNNNNNTNTLQPPSWQDPSMASTFGQNRNFHQNLVDLGAFMDQQNQHNDATRALLTMQSGANSLGFPHNNDLFRQQSWPQQIPHPSFNGFIQNSPAHGMVQQVQQLQQQQLHQQINNSTPQSATTPLACAQHPPSQTTNVRNEQEVHESSNVARMPPIFHSEVDLGEESKKAKQQNAKCRTSDLDGDNECEDSKPPATSKSEEEESSSDDEEELGIAVEQDGPIQHPTKMNQFVPFDADEIKVVEEHLKAKWPKLWSSTTKGVINHNNMTPDHLAMYHFGRVVEEKNKKGTVIGFKVANLVEGPRWRMINDEAENNKNKSRKKKDKAADDAKRTKKRAFEEVEKIFFDRLRSLGHEPKLFVSNDFIRDAVKIAGFEGDKKQGQGMTGQFKKAFGFSWTTSYRKNNGPFYIYCNRCLKADKEHCSMDTLRFYTIAEGTYTTHDRFDKGKGFRVDMTVDRMYFHDKDCAQNWEQKKYETWKAMVNRRPQCPPNQFPDRRCFMQNFPFHSVLGETHNGVVDCLNTFQNPMKKTPPGIAIVFGANNLVVPCNFDDRTCTHFPDTRHSKCISPINHHWALARLACCFINENNLMFAFGAETPEHMYPNFNKIRHKRKDKDGTREMLPHLPTKDPKAKPLFYFKASLIFGGHNVDRCNRELSAKEQNERPCVHQIAHGDYQPIKLNKKDLQHLESESNDDEEQESDGQGTSSSNNEQGTSSSSNESSEEPSDDGVLKEPDAEPGYLVSDNPLLKDKFHPGSLIVPIDDYRNLLFKANEEEVTKINKGELCYFAGDTTHSGWTHKYIAGNPPKWHAALHVEIPFYDHPVTDDHVHIHTFTGRNHCYYSDHHAKVLDASHKELAENVWKGAYRIIKGVLMASINNSDDGKVHKDLKEEVQKAQNEIQGILDKQHSPKRKRRRGTTNNK